MIFRPKFFTIGEMVPRDIIEGYQDNLQKLWLLFDPRVLWTNDALRRRYGKLVMNTYPWGGDSQYRGFRPWDSSTGAMLSQHKFGRASDLVPVDVTAEEIRQEIRERPDLDEFKHMRAIENGTAWLHYDVRNWIGSIQFFDP